MDITELNNALSGVREALAERDRLSRELGRLEKSLEEEHRQLQRMSDELDKENEDVRRLENTSLVGLFFAVMGSKDAHLERERLELLAAKLRYNNSQRRVTALERDQADLRTRLRRLGGGPQTLQQRYEALLAEKEQWLVSQNGPAARQLTDLDARLADLRAKEHELREAFQAGNQALAGLKRVVEALESASGWGTWDLLGGGLIASAVKHGRLDEANDAVQEVQPHLQRFERELADVGGAAALQVETGGLTAFADIFIDGLLVDLLVQSRISESLDAARAMYQQVAGLLERLTKRREEMARCIQDEANERKALLEQV